MNSEPQVLATLTSENKLQLIADIVAEARPAIQADGGDIEFLGLRGQRVEVRLTGKCLTCALAGQTLGGIRRRLVRALDEPLMVVPIMD
ncbi:NifU family protein [Methylocystis parvus]|nr:NifU family protein [Methylocystis parvus]WBJ98550.1 NifU family protein [Methylocystis parvus OBBP]